ncbi:MAG TPA: DMT family transporter [Actinomycetota bacterium]|nr:DMT family transporter [Actinomycetota bacterium]
MTSRAGIVEIIVCTLAWGTIGPIVEHISLSSTVIVFFRLGFGMTVVLGWLVARRRLAELRPRARFGLLLSSGVVLGAHWVLLFAAYKRIGVDTTILIVFVAPVLWTAAAPIVLRERVRASSFAALAIAFGGVALISVPKIGHVNAVGLVDALVSGLLFAVLLLVTKICTEEYPPAAIVVWQQGVATLLLSPALAGASVHQVARGLPLLVLLGAVYTGMLGIILFHAVRALEAQQIGVLWYLEPASAVLFAWWLLGEHPAGSTIAGGLLIVLAGIGIIVAGRSAVEPAPVVQEVSS